MNGGKRLLGELLFPKQLVCFVCDAETHIGPDGLCSDCRKRLRFSGDVPCSGPLDGMRAGLMYDEPLHWVAHRFKYSRQVWLADCLAAFMDVPISWGRIDCFVPVPLHMLRLWRRTYNQSQLLAESVRQRHPAIPVRSDLIKRKRNTSSQTSLSGAERRRNVRGAFVANPAAKGLRIVLVDDVATTGSTLAACAAALKRAGAEAVFALCACRAGY